MWPALLIGLLSAAALGLIVHLVVFRPLRSAPPLAKVVASVGVAIALQALVVLRFGTGRRAVPPALPDDPVQPRLAHASPRTASGSPASSPSSPSLLWAYGRFTRSGLATRAAAECERGAILLGWSPDRLAAATWVLGRRRSAARSPCWSAPDGRARPGELDAHGRARPGLRARGPADVGRRRLRGRTGARRGRVGDHVPVVPGLVARLGDGRRVAETVPLAGHRGRPVRARTGGCRDGDRPPSTRCRRSRRPASGRRSSPCSWPWASPPAAHRRQLPVRRDHLDDRGAAWRCRWWCSPASSARSRWPRRRSPASAGFVLSKIGTGAAVPAVAARRRAGRHGARAARRPCPPCGSGASSSRWSRWPPASPSSSSCSGTPS